MRFILLQVEENMFQQKHIVDEFRNELELLVRAMNDACEIEKEIYGAKLLRLEKAIKKCEDDTYGLCEMCGNPISDERLKKYRDVSFCITCQSKIERR